MLVVVVVFVASDGDLHRNPPCESQTGTRGNTFDLLVFVTPVVLLLLTLFVLTQLSLLLWVAFAFSLQESLHRTFIFVKFFFYVFCRSCMLTFSFYYSVWRC